MTVDCYDNGIAPCIDCRACRAQAGCAVKDGMQAVYDYIKDCDNVVIATPIYFSQPTGRLLDVWSRFQTFFSAKYFRHEDTAIKPKKGAVILTGGGSGGAQEAYETAALLLRSVNAKDIFPPVCSLKTDSIPACEDADALEKVKRAAAFMNNR